MVLDPVTIRRPYQQTIKSYCKASTCRGFRACRDCKNIYSRATRKLFVELSPEAQQKANCRAHTKVLQSRGTLPKGPCEGCGADDAGNHHPDYARPRYYIRLCKDCHAIVHAWDLA